MTNERMTNDKEMISCILTPAFWLLFLASGF